MSDETKDDVIDQHRQQMKSNMEEAKPTLSLLQHFTFYVSRNKNKYEIVTLDGKVFDNLELDFQFTDGLSVVFNGDRIYLPLTSILRIRLQKHE